MKRPLLDPAPLTGLAIGDALGMPFESIPPTYELNKVRIQAWDGISFQGSDFMLDEDSELEDYHKLKAGQWTDDTQMTMALGSSILESGFYDPVKAAANYLAWYQSPDCRGIGGITRKAMLRLRDGVPCTESGIPDAQGNGTAMRAAPLGIQKSLSLKDVMAQAQADAVITHNDPEAIIGSMTVALTVFLASGGFKEEMLDLLKGLLPGPSKLGGWLEVLRINPLADNATMIEKMGWANGAEGHVLKTVPAALFCFLRTDTFLDAIVMAVKLGGDTDTTAAITGAFAGAYYGYSAIPKQYIEQLERAQDLRLMELRLLAL